MINIDDYTFFIENKKTLKEISVDDSDPDNPKYMTESSEEAVCFDGVKDSYTNIYGDPQNTVKSVDGLIKVDKDIVLIEFKNGVISDSLKKEIGVKIRDSLLIFGDITETTIGYSRKYMDFILVYNEEKNQPSKVKIGSYLMKKADENYVRFGMKKYKGIYFKAVYTYSEQEFEKHIQ